MKRLIILAIMGCVGAAGCGATSTISQPPNAQATVDSTVAASAPTPTSLPQPLPTATAQPTPVPTSMPAAPVSWLDGYSVGSCFNNIGGEGENADVGQLLDCATEHENEIFAIGLADYPLDAPYPDSDALVDELYATFCDRETEVFGGEPWDELPFATSVWWPDESDWLAGDRTVACTANAAIAAENSLKVGTAAGGTLDSVEGIVGRSTVDEQVDFYFSFETSALYRLTMGDFSLENTTPDILDSGFLFGAPRTGVDVEGAGAYSYSFDDGEIVELATSLPEDWTVSSPHFILERPAFVFAARESEVDDWDIYLSTTEAGAVNLTDSDGADQWPTLTPAQDKILYNADSNIWIMGVDGSNKRQLTTTGDNYEAAISPDGTRVAFASSRSGNDDIWIMNIDGSGQTNLTNHPGAEAWPFFSADGQRIYFQTDRLGVQSNIMMMELDGSNQSWYSFEFITNAALLPQPITDRFASELTPLGDTTPPNGVDIVGGAPGEFTSVAHSSGRFEVGLPAGWQWQEVDVGAAAIVAAPSLDAFADTWAHDGVQISVGDYTTIDDWDVFVSEAAAIADCDAGERSRDLDGDLIATTEQFTCGEGTAWLIGVYNTATSAGLLFEGQFDSEPSVTIDEELLVMISEGLIWG